MINKIQNFIHGNPANNNNGPHPQHQRHNRAKSVQINSHNKQNRNRRTITYDKRRTITYDNLGDTVTKHQHRQHINLKKAISSLQNKLKRANAENQLQGNKKRKKKVKVDQTESIPISDAFSQMRGIELVDKENKWIATSYSNKGDWCCAFGKVQTSENGRYHWKINVFGKQKIDYSIIIGILDHSCLANHTNKDRNIFVYEQRGYGIETNGDLKNNGKNMGKMCQPWDSKVSDQNDSKGVILDLYVDTAKSVMCCSVNEQEFIDICDIAKDTHYVLAVAMSGQYQQVEILQCDFIAYGSVNKEDNDDKNEDDEYEYYWEDEQEQLQQNDDHENQEAKSEVKEDENDIEIDDEYEYYYEDEEEQTYDHDEFIQHEHTQNNSLSLLEEDIVTLLEPFGYLPEDIHTAMEYTHDINEMLEYLEKQYLNIPVFDGAKLYDSNKLCVIDESMQQSPGPGNALDKFGVMDGPKLQFYNFLKNIRLEKYYKKFEVEEGNDIRDAKYLLDKGFLRNDIGMKMVECNRFLDECEKLKNDMDIFAASGIIPSILIHKLAKSGIVTMNILCNEIADKSELRSKLNISNDNQCDLLWNIITDQINVNDNSYQNNEEMEEDGHEGETNVEQEDEVFGMVYNTPM